MGFVLLLGLQCAAGVIATISDLRTGKICNKHLVLIGLFGSGVYAAFHHELVDGYGKDVILNAVTSLVISFLLFYTRFWAAGDAKLFYLTAMLMPFSLYPQGLLFPAFYLLMVTFCLAFIYGLLESIYYCLVDSRRPIAERRFPRLTTFSKASVLDWLLRYLSASLMLGVAYRLLDRISPEIVSRDRGLVMIAGVLLLVMLYARLKTRRTVYVAIVIGLLANVVYILATGVTPNGPFDVRGPLIVLGALLVRHFTARYDYMRIPVAELQPGMVLSALTIAAFRLSRASGLPQTTTETTKSRLSGQQVASIRKWSASEPGSAHVVVVKHVPFAPFILGGTICYVLLGFVRTFGG
jgi:Flp pilus assembly protein protease CpaA